MAIFGPPKCGHAAPSRVHFLEKLEVQEVGSIWGRAGAIGLEKAVEVLDNLGSAVSTLNAGIGSSSLANHRGNKISILAFEVANTISMAEALMQSLSEDSVRLMKSEVLRSEGVKNLVSTDSQELMRISAADKREELDALCREVIRFGNQCQNPELHNLGRYFQKLELETGSRPEAKEMADAAMRQLANLAICTVELYHEINMLEGLEKDSRRKVKEDNSPLHGSQEESLTPSHEELKRQRKLVESLKKKSLWSKSLDEVVEKFVDIVTSLNENFFEVFGRTDMKDSKSNCCDEPQRLGALGLSLHYANSILLIDNAVSRPMHFPTSARNKIYQALPSPVKAALRSRLKSFNVGKEMSAAEIKVEMKKILQWLAPMADGTSKAHHGFGWVGEWANTSIEFNKPEQQSNMARILTLHHADREKTDEFILQLAVWLHHFRMQLKARVLQGGDEQKPSQNFTEKTILPLFLLSEDDRKALKGMDLDRRPILRRSKSHGWTYKSKRKRRMTRSLSHGHTLTLEELMFRT